LRIFTLYHATISGLELFILLDCFIIFIPAQIASVILWFSDEYYYYATAIVIMSAGGIGTSVYQMVKVGIDLWRRGLLAQKHISEEN
jgi:hypothetical protein